MDAVSSLETALGAELLRAELLGARRPRIAERYIVERFLGRGATGVVVAAMDERLGRPVALKLSIAGADDTGLNEARALARLDHPNVVRVLDAEVGSAILDGRPFRLQIISMQRVEGVTLRVWLREKQRTDDEIVQLFVRAGAGLAAAHREKIIHRDFKPENVIVKPDGEPQVLDFGFAIATSSTGPLPNVADVAGTDAYLAPEARAGAPTALSDQYAFAISIVDGLTGAPAPPASRIPPEGVDRALWDVLRRASHPEPTRRFPDMAALLDALNNRPRGPSIWRVLFVSALVLLFFNRARVETTYDGWMCGRLPETSFFRTRVMQTSVSGLAVGSWGFYELRLTRVAGCEMAAEVIRRCDSGQPIEYRVPPRGDGRGQAVPPLFGATLLRLRDVEIANPRRDAPGYRYSFDLQLGSDRVVGGTGVASSSAGIPMMRLNVEPLSRSPCLPGHDVRRTE